MTNSSEMCLDTRRKERLGFGEAIFCLSKSIDQINAILAQLRNIKQPALLTRLDVHKFSDIDDDLQSLLSYCKRSQTAFFDWNKPQPFITGRCAIVTAGTSDVPVSLEVSRTLEFSGVKADMFHDRGVAGLWRVTELIPELSKYDVVVVVAGMDAALPTVLGGAISAAIIAVPTSVGYGVAEKGHTALHSILASCAPGIVTVNIDNGYGAACAVLRIL